MIILEHHQYITDTMHKEWYYSKYTAFIF